MNNIINKLKDLNLKAQVWVMQRAVSMQGTRTKEEMTNYINASFNITERLCYLLIGIAIATGDVRAWIMTFTAFIILVVLIYSKKAQFKDEPIEASTQTAKEQPTQEGTNSSQDL